MFHSHAFHTLDLTNRIYDNLKICSDQLFFENQKYGFSLKIKIQTMTGDQHKKEMTDSIKNIIKELSAL